MWRARVGDVADPEFTGRTGSRRHVVSPPYMPRRWTHNLHPLGGAQSATGEAVRTGGSRSSPAFSEQTMHLRCAKTHRSVEVRDIFPHPPFRTRRDAHSLDPAAENGAGHTYETTHLARNAARGGGFRHSWRVDGLPCPVHRARVGTRQRLRPRRGGLLSTLVDACF